MKVYEGQRTMDGIVVTVDGVPLDDRRDVRQFSPYGFEWAYEGAEPRQLALAILVDHLGDAERAATLSAPFAKTIVANLDNAWRLTGEEIDSVLKKIESEAASDA